jgi:hypothetical protein
MGSALQHEPAGYDRTGRREGSDRLERAAMCDMCSGSGEQILGGSVHHHVSPILRISTSYDVRRHSHLRTSALGAGSDASVGALGRACWGRWGLVVGVEECSIKIPVAIAHPAHGAKCFALRRELWLLSGG